MIDSRYKLYSFFLALVSPVMLLVNIFKARNEKQIIFYGTMFMGFAGSVFVYVPGTDGHTHLQMAKYVYMNMPFDEFVKLFGKILTFNATKGATDIYIHIIDFISAAVFKIPELIHIFTGLVLGYFYTKSILLVLRNRLLEKKSFLFLAFITLFLMIRSITALNSIRMYTGMWILFYGSYSWMLTKKKKYLLVTLLAVAVHFSYSIILIPLVLAYYFKSRKLIVTGLYIISFAFSLSYGSISNYIPDNELFKNKVKYNVIQDPDYVAQSVDRSHLRFYKAWGETAYVNYSIVILSFIMLFFYFDKNIDQSLLFLISSGLILYSFANLVGFSPSLVGRTKTVASTFVLASAVYALGNISLFYFQKQVHTLIKTGLSVFLISSIPMALFHISYMIYGISIFILGAPIISWVLGNGDLSIREVLGYLIF